MAEVLVEIALFLFNIIKYSTYLVLLLIIGSVITIAITHKKHPPTKIDVGKLRKGDVILVGSNKKFHAWYIQASNLLTNGSYSKIWTHAALYIGGGRLIEAEEKGLAYNTIDNYLKKGRLIKVYRHKYISDSSKILDKAVQFCERSKEEDYRYGWVALAFFVFASCLPVAAGFVFNNKFVDKLCSLDKGYFCSELVADAYVHAESRISPFDSWRIKPSDFMKNPFFEEVTFQEGG